MDVAERTGVAERADAHVAVERVAGADAAVETGRRGAQVDHGVAVGACDAVRTLTGEAHAWLRCACGAVLAHVRVAAKVNLVDKCLNG